MSLKQFLQKWIPALCKKLRKNKRLKHYTVSMETHDALMCDDSLEQFPKSVKRFSDKNCGEKQTVETQISDSIESHAFCSNAYMCAGG